MARLLTVTKLRLYPLINRVMATAGSISGDGKNFNRLASEKSPYLLQHATNPVDWSVKSLSFVFEACIDQTNAS